MFPGDAFPDLLVGLTTEDDAAVYKINDSTATILTVDFITPIVDDPTDFGRIAAANSLSDVYAMGGKPVLALNIAAFPKKLPDEIMMNIFIGGAEKVAEAGAVIGGGHTINDDEPKYGLVVMGLVHPDEIITKTKARPGDRLILTKPLGSGAITTAHKQDKVSTTALELATRWMSKLNKNAGQLVHGRVMAGTDVTGFSLLGHAFEIADKSGVGIDLFVDTLPLLNGSISCAEEKTFPGGTYANMKAYREAVNFESSISENIQLLLYTPETSGGLLLAVPQDELPSIEKRFNDSHEPYWLVGNVVPDPGLRILAPDYSFNFTIITQSPL